MSDGREIIRRAAVVLGAAVLAGGIACADCDGEEGRSCRVPTDCGPGYACIDGRCVRLADGGDGSGGDSGDAREDGTGPWDGWDEDGAACARASDRAVPMPVDIIIAIDQSASMGEERAGVEATINASLAATLEAARLDYRVILIHGGFCMEPPLGDPSDCTASNPPRYHRVNYGVNSSDALTVFLWSYEGAQRTPNTCDRNEDRVLAWRDVLRFESQKVFIVVTDDDPTSFSREALGCGPCDNFQCPTYADRAADWGGADFPTELYALEPAGMFGSPGNPKWIFHSIIGVRSVLEADAALEPLDATCAFGGNTAETAGVEYQKLSRLTGGVRFPSCDTDYGPVFERIASEVLPLACTYALESTSLGEIDPTLVNVVFDPGDGTGPRTIPQDTRYPCEEGAEGWQWNADHTLIRICGEPCQEVTEAVSGEVTITVGCATVFL